MVAGDLGKLAMQFTSNGNIFEVCCIDSVRVVVPKVVHTIRHLNELLGVVKECLFCFLSPAFGTSSTTAMIIGTLLLHTMSWTYVLDLRVPNGVLGDGVVVEACVFCVAFLDKLCVGLFPGHCVFVDVRITREEPQEEEENVGEVQRICFIFSLGGYSFRARRARVFYAGRRVSDEQSFSAP